MPQTIEAINHASAAGVPIVFAINKIDKPHANPEKIKEELANMNYLVEDWGVSTRVRRSPLRKYRCRGVVGEGLVGGRPVGFESESEKTCGWSIIESSLDKGRAMYLPYWWRTVR